MAAEGLVWRAARSPVGGGLSIELVEKSTCTRFICWATAVGNAVFDTITASIDVLLNEAGYDEE